MGHEKDSSPRTATGYYDSIAGTVISNDDPLHIGRICIYPDHWDPSTIPVTSGVWAHLESHLPQTGGQGHTRHVYHLAGSRVHLHYGHAGHSTIRDAKSSYGGQEPSPGSASSVIGPPGYPSNVPKQYK